jgi:hypothetical protein
LKNRDALEILTKWLSSIIIILINFSFFLIKCFT